MRDTERRSWWRDLNVWAIGLFVLSLGMSVSAMIKFSGVNFQWGTVADWFSAIGSILAAAVAVAIAVHGNRRQDRREAEEQQKAEDRARRRASRTEVSHAHIRATNEEDGGHAEIAVMNGGDGDLYELQWFTPLLVTFTDQGEVESVNYAVGATIIVSGDERPLESMRPRTLAPTRASRIHVPRPRIGDKLPSVTELVSYVDADGYRIGRIYRRNTNPHIAALAHAEWAVVDDDYPASVDGFTGELFEFLDQAPPSDGSARDIATGQ